MPGGRPKSMSKMTVVNIRKDEEHNAYLIKAEGPFGARMSWFDTSEPKYKVGDEFAVKLDWK